MPYYKIAPLRRAYRELFPKQNIISWMGISVDEIYRVKSSQRKYITHRYPLIELGMSRSDCLMWMYKSGYPTPPRSACVYCPFHSNQEWSRLKKEEPKEFEKAVIFEIDLQRTMKETGMNGIPYLHRSGVNLSSVNFDPNDTINLFNNECEGACGV